MKFKIGQTVVVKFYNLRHARVGTIVNFFENSNYQYIVHVKEEFTILNKKSNYMVYAKETEMTPFISSTEVFLECLK